MGKLRVAKLGEVLKQEISQLIQRELKDPRIGFVSITQVMVTGDLRCATVYVSVLGNETEKEITIEGLARAAGFIRSELARRIRLRHVPELTFCLDESIAYGIKLTEFIDRLQEGAQNDDHTSASTNKNDLTTKP